MLNQHQTLSVFLQEHPSAVQQSAGKATLIAVCHWPKVPREIYVTSVFAPHLLHSDIQRKR